MQFSFSVVVNPMNSSISPFKPWLLALLALVIIELTYYGVIRPPRITWNSFLDLNYAETESFQRLVAHDKIVAFDKADPNIIQVGDSSGLHSVQPPVVMSHIPGWNYLNMSVATNLGYNGYYNMARLQLERSPNARYLVLYTSPMGGVPRKLLWDGEQKLMAPQIHNEFISPLHRLIQLPTLAARKEVIDYGYYLGYRLKSRNEPISTNRGYLAFDAVFRSSNGWTRETDIEGDVKANIYKVILPEVDAYENASPEMVRNGLRKFPKVTDEKFYNWKTLTYESYFDHIYGRFAELAKEYGVKLVIIFNPVPASASRAEFEEFIEWNAIKAGLNRLRSMHPGVIVTDIDFWPDEKFSVFSHISTLNSTESSHRVGMILRKIIGNEQPASRSRLKPIAVSQGDVDIDFSKPYAGYGWTDQAGTTNQFPLQYVGPRNKGWIYTSLKEGSAYTVRAVFRGDVSEMAQRLLFKANGLSMQKLVTGQTGDELWAEWLVPKEAVDSYRGWMTLEFDLSDVLRETGGRERTVEFLRVMAIPHGQPLH